MARTRFLLRRTVKLCRTAELIGAAEQLRCRALHPRLTFRDFARMVAPQKKYSF
jgi:hypothetical protein